MNQTETISLNSINVLTVIIEDCPIDKTPFSVLAYDNEGGVWVEKFAATMEQAEIMKNKIVKNIKAQY